MQLWYRAAAAAVTLVFFIWLSCKLSVLPSRQELIDHLLPQDTANSHKSNNHHVSDQKSGLDESAPLPNEAPTLDNVQGPPAVDTGFRSSHKTGIPASHKTGLPEPHNIGSPLSHKTGLPSSHKSGSKSNPKDGKNGSTKGGAKEGSAMKSILKGVSDDLKEAHVPKKKLVLKGDKVVVVGKTSQEDTDWISTELPDWQHAIYTVDNNSVAGLHTDFNKGKEANVYLTYIIEHYHNLPLSMAFIHSHQKGWPEAWHTDAPDNDNARSLQALQLDYIQSSGYANLRCNTNPGCPDEVQPFRQPVDRERTAELEFAAAWTALFNNTDVPKIVATPCCAQFAVSRAQVLERSKEEYIWYHRWLMDTPLNDALSGRIFEYLWHIIFGRDPVFCPDTDTCNSEVYGRASSIEAYIADNPN